MSGVAAGRAHPGQGAHHLQLAGGLARQIEQTPEAAGAEPAEREFEQYASLAITGGGLEEQDRRRGVTDGGMNGAGLPLSRLRRDFAEGGEQFVLDRFLAGAQRGESGTKLQPSEPVACADLKIEKLRQPFELGVKRDSSSAPRATVWVIPAPISTKTSSAWNTEPAGGPSSSGKESS